MCICVFVYILVYMYVIIVLFVLAFTVHACMPACMHTHTYIYTYIHTYTYVRTYVHTYIHTHTISTCMLAEAEGNNLNSSSHHDVLTLHTWPTLRTVFPALAAGSKEADQVKRITVASALRISDTDP